MKLADVYKVIDGLYPKRLSDEYVEKFGARDNSGILVDTGDEIEGAVFSLDLSKGAIEEAKKSGANLIVTHHPAIFFPIRNVLVDTPLGRRLIECVRSGISVISMHLNMDCAPNGIDHFLAEGIGGSVLETCEKIDGGSYGRVCSIVPVLFSELKKRIEKVFCTSRLLAYGEDGRIGKVASFCGAGIDDSAVAYAKEHGADAIVSSDVKHNYICDILESGMRLIVLTHYASENYGFKKIYQGLSDKIGVPSRYHEDTFML